ncbi:MAG: flagellar hook capping FlgD N-terminal domain-containing protein [Pseudomonadota bacterium]
MSGTLTATAAAASRTTSTGTTAAMRSGGIAGDFNTFLTLLTTQLRNQSPTDPLDTNQMTAQLVQFASVEQQMSTNQNLAQLLSLQQNSALTAAAGLVGRRVEVESDRLSLQGGVAGLRLPAAGTASAARITIADGTGRLVRQLDVPLGSAMREWAWDGRSNAGVRQADGAYRVSVAGLGADGQTTGTPPAFTVVGTATGATRSSTGVALSLGALSLPYGQLRSVAAM